MPSSTGRSTDARNVTGVGTTSANATATDTVAVVMGGAPGAALGLGFTGWSPETDAEAATYSIAGGAGASAPSALADAVTRVAQRNR